MNPRETAVLSGSIFTQATRPAPTSGVPERTTFKLSWCWLLLVAGLFLDELGNALPVDRSLGELQHLTWGVRDGAPADIWAITQSADGFLLLGTGSGLYRFDGVSFEHITNANDPAVTFRDITALMALPSGELWIGYYAGGASLLSNGHITTFGVNDGVPQGWVTAFATEENGTVWLSALQGLARFSGGRWERIGAAWNFASAGAHWVLIDGRGTLWVAGGDKVAFLRRGSRQFEDSGVKGDFKSTLAMAPDGTVWLASESFGPRPLRLPEDVARPVAVGASWDLPPAKRLMFDREGTMWATDAVRGGVYRFALPKPDIKTRNVSPRETFTEGDGLASDIAVPLFEDREGNIWVGTNLGLNVFRATNFVKETRIPITKTGYAISADREDGVWIGAGKLIYRAKEKRVDLAAKSDSPIRSAFRSPDGTIWFGTNNGLIKIKDGIAKTILLPNDDHTARYEYVNSISAAEDGNLNVSIVGRGLGRFDGSTWLIPNDQGNPTNKSPVALWTDNLKRLWSGYSDGTVKAAEGDAQRTYGKEEGLTIGPITAIGGDGPLILAAGEWGIARFNGRRFESLDASRSEAFSGVTGIVATPNHDVWLNGHQGVVRLSPEQLRNYIDRPEKRPQPELFDLLDGLPGIAQQGVDHTAAVSTDGRLWFSTNHGVAWIDPLHLLKNNLSPRVVIRSFEADEKNLAPTEPVELPQLTRTIRIGFTALSLTAPQRIRFRYMLEGADDTWREGGNERRVVYANLRPGRYVFRVIASNNDGVWNDTGAALSFNLPPTFYQTKWFLGLCIAVAVLLMAALFVLRVRQIKHRLRARLEQRIEDKIGERTRIARELHDSLLQSFLGLMFRLQAVRELLPVQPGNAAQVLDRAMERGDEAINEGREALADLRDSRNAVDLVESLKILGRQLESESSTGRPPRFRVLIEGRTRPLNPLVRDEIYRVAREALRNAYRHAKARAIEAELYYGASQFRLRVRDDGIGIEPQVLNQGGRHGHWGLPGMRERANSMGGELQFWSESMRGTKIELCLSAKIAYVNYVMSLLPRTREATRP